MTITSTITFKMAMTITMTMTMTLTLTVIMTLTMIMTLALIMTLTMSVLAATMAFHWHVLQNSTTHTQSGIEGLEIRIY